MIGRILAVLFGLVLGVAGVLLLFWLLWSLWKRREEEDVSAIELELEAPTVAERSAAVGDVAAAAPDVVDDLKRIEGIGPKIAGVLHEAGIMNFAQLAATEMGRIKQILEEADPRLLRLADPTTWPEQARLAAAGDWDALQALQDALKGGRRA